MKKKLLMIMMALAITFALMPQSAFGASAVSFSSRPVIKAETTGQRTVKVSWTEVKGAAGYELYRGLPGKSFVKIKTLKSPSSLSYVDRGRKSNTSYYYRVKAYKVINGKKVYGRYSWSARGDAGLPQDVMNLQLEGSGEKDIGFYWNYAGKADGCYVYRSESEEGDFSLIDRVTPREDGYWHYVDDAVQSGKNYFYRVQPFADCKGTLVKGRMSKVFAASAIYNLPVADVTLSEGNASNEVIFKVTMETFTYDTEFAVSTDLTVEKEQRMITLQQHWQNGEAEETRETFLHIGGLSKDGITYKEEGTITVKGGETIYIKASCSDAISIGTGESNHFIIRCLYNGKASALDNL
ncbi:Uncharacterised protein [uncultured Eubacterium sp.]|nr:Uncharacterised protein [uncultured Eubacterium sp.]